MENSTHLALPYIMPSQAQKHVTHNEAIAMLDALVQLSVIDRDLTAPPGGESEGDRYIVAATATGDWAGKEDKIAVYRDDAWLFFTPQPGWVAWVTDEVQLCYWTGSAWAGLTSALTVFQNLSLLGVGTAADATNPFSAKLNKALWTARTAGEGGDGDLRYTMNKETAGDVNSLLMQTGFSGRAELGLIGDDDFMLKVSADGSAWTTAMTIDKTTGAVRLPAGSAASPALKVGDGDSGLAGGDNILAFVTGATEQARFGTSGNFLIGGSSAYGTRTGGTGLTVVTPKMQILSTGPDASLMLARFANNVGAPYLFSAKSRGANVGDNTVVQAGDDLATFSFAGVASSGNQGEAARINVNVAGTPGTERTPGRIDFMTTDGTATVAVRVTVAETGALQMGAARDTVIDASRRFVIGASSEFSAANIANVAHAVNTTGKLKGLIVWDTTNNRALRASGTAAADPWHVLDGSATVTPA